MILKVKNISEIGGVVKAPPSKSYSHRAVILASLAKGTSKLYDMLYSEDTLASIRVCKALGAKISRNDDYLEVSGTGGKLHNSQDAPIDLANSGTTLRLMTSVSALSDNEVVLTGDDSLQTRPMGLLMNALWPLGIETESLNDNEKAPILIKPGYHGGETNIYGNVSSQFISSILISSPLSEVGVTLYVLPEFKSKPYVNMTLDIMRKFGVKVLKGYYLKHESCDKEHQNCKIDEFKVIKQDYVACNYTVEGDYSSASYLLALIAINGGRAIIKNLFFDSKQGDKVILDILQKMGATIIRGEDYVEIASEGNLKAIDVDLSNAPDLLITVAVLAAMADGTTNITGVAHARVKETDRIDTTCRELEKLGCKLEEHEDGMSITGGVTSGRVDSHGDHRLAMAFSLIGLKHDIEITNGEVFDVSFPNFIEAMAELGFELELKNE
ncbi:MAG: 3-phosphoshikimate 1-carboxyvinyltransferase [Methanobrevibacter sp.]|uniref:3-phosphoshikimate 1-carboxyvinyltransferase n=1 Tax=Methanobrevibacter sp. TaxID=66852 RepID=UPI0025D03317|nr:3-phosphoshikimate 1-carboxyvinyltransferase [Methanobrevibacter sp.]MEE0902528.1 3-phosphoshikimate 1-carboxyvinyltransferase [Methanobrevibacter sp.]MEE0936268.1 3-phosphoshikimate 1-carboxyvinyltransferase [Methanobrevibacter sp.]